MHLKRGDKDQSEPTDRVFVKDYELLLFAKNIGKNLNRKYSQKFIYSAKIQGNLKLELVI